jgi:hypothetical protein
MCLQLGVFRIVPERSAPRGDDLEGRLKNREQFETGVGLGIVDGKKGLWGRGQIKSCRRITVTIHLPCLIVARAKSFRSCVDWQ